MIVYVFIIIILTSIIILLSLKSTLLFKSKKKSLIFKVLLLIIVNLVSIMLYFNFSNYWIGTTLVEKFKTQTNTENREANEIAIIREAMINLEKELITFPNNIEKILELAEIKFILGYLEDALNLYNKARGLSPKNINIMLSEVRIRVILESENLSQETLKLLNNILFIEENNVMALYIMGNYKYANKDFTEAKKIFLVLESLLKKNTQEYNEIQNKIFEMEKK
ncbi:hypothetical protein OA264_02300 [Alphaproteobacteria bacterium]|nr:hypothetical protein [Alphaproteobacteria bacterium]